MNPKIHISTILTALVTGGIALCILAWWLWHDPTAHLKVNLPGQDNAVAMRAKQKEVIHLGELSEQNAVFPSAHTGSWPGFRGVGQTNISQDNVKLADSWPAEGPPIRWSLDMGEGHAAAAIHKGRVFLLDYDELRKADILRCLSLESGEEIWHRGYRVKIKRNHGISRTIPAVTDDYVVSIGPRCHVMCVRTDSGEFVWGMDMESDLETKTPFWYTGQCPLIDGDTVVLAPGGSELLMGVDLATGEKVWSVPNTLQWNMSHASVSLMTLNGKRMYVYPAIGGVVGVSAEANDMGRLLWSNSAWKHSVVAPSALKATDQTLFLTAGYGAGSMVLKVVLDESENAFKTEVLQQYAPKSGLASEQQTPVLMNGLLYGIQPKDAGGYRNQFVCVDPTDCTNILWASGKSKRFGLGPYMIADDKFYILDDSGNLTMAAVTKDKYQELAAFPIIPDGHDAWGPLAVADGFMILRDSKHMVCIDLSEKGIMQ